MKLALVILDTQISLKELVSHNQDELPLLAQPNA